MRQKGFTPLVLILLIALSIGGYFIWQRQGQTENNSSKMKSKDTVIATPIPPAVQSIYEPEAGMIDYKNGQEIKNYKFSLIYPSNWNLELTQEFMQVTGSEGIGPDKTIPRLHFSLKTDDPSITQKGEKLWSGFSIDVTKKYATVEGWFNDFLKGDFQTSEWSKRKNYTYTTEQIGNKTAYQITISNDAPDYMQAGFVRRTVILGTYYSYVYGGFQNGYGDMQIFSKRLNQEILPGLKFE